jgi:hypothetical protein
MTGRYEFEINDNGEPFYDISLSGDPIRMTWENTTLFTHSEQHDNIDHVFVDSGRVNEETGTAIGAFIFRFVIPDFDDLSTELEIFDYPHIHMPEPFEVDVEVYKQARADWKQPEVHTIVEVGDDEVVDRAMANFDEEWGFYGTE